MKKHKLTKKERKILRDDILLRYDNIEYWDLGEIDICRNEYEIEE